MEIDFEKIKLTMLVHLRHAAEMTIRELADDFTVALAEEYERGHRDGLKKIQPLPDPTSALSKFNGKLVQKLQSVNRE